MKYEEPNMQIVMLDDNEIPITQISEGDSWNDWDDGGLPED